MKRNEKIKQTRWDFQLLNDNAIRAPCTRTGRKSTRQFLLNWKHLLETLSSGSFVLRNFRSKFNFGKEWIVYLIGLGYLFVLLTSIKHNYKSSFLNILNQYKSTKRRVSSHTSALTNGSVLATQVLYGSISGPGEASIIDHNIPLLIMLVSPCRGVILKLILPKLFLVESLYIIHYLKIKKPSLGCVKLIFIDVSWKLLYW